MWIRNARVEGSSPPSGSSKIKPSSFFGRKAFFYFLQLSAVERATLFFICTHMINEMSANANSVAWMSGLIFLRIMDFYRDFILFQSAFLASAF